MEIVKRCREIIIMVTRRRKPPEQIINELKELQYRYVYAITHEIKHVCGVTPKRKHVWDSRRRHLVEVYRLMADNEVAGLSDTRPIGRKL